jgi:hypothetical protein
VIENNPLMVFFPWCVLQVNEATTLSYAPSWIFRLNLETIEFPITTPKYFLNYLHLGLQHQSLLAASLIL